MSWQDPISLSDRPPWANIYHTTLSTTNPSSSHTKRYIYDIYVELDEAVLEYCRPILGN